MLNRSPDADLNSDRISDAAWRPEGFRQAPHNLEAEQALLGAILVDNRALERVDFLEPLHFFDPLHQQIFETAATMIKASSLVSPITMRTFFENAPEISPRLSVPQYLGTLAANATSIINAVDYGRTIYDLATRRALIVIGEDMVNTAYDSAISVNPAEQIEETEQRLGQLAKGKDDDRAVSFDIAIEDVLLLADQAHKRDGSLAGHSTGLVDLDQKLGGLAKSNLIILAGRPSMGKTALGTQIATSIARHGQHVDFYSLEMSRSEITARILASEVEISSEKIRRGTCTAEEASKVQRVGPMLKKWPLNIDDRGGLTIAQLSARARRSARKNRTELIVVDYLQLMNGAKGSRDGRVRDVAEITNGLKALAKELEIPIIALSQLSRATETREDKRPQLSDLRESGSIEQDADVVMFVYREEYYVERREPEVSSPKHAEWQTEMLRAAGKAEVIIGKQRHGPTGVVPLAFEGSLTRFSDLAYRGRQ